MKLARTLRPAGGAVNALFRLFHCWLGWQIHHWTTVPLGVRGLMEMFSGGGARFILLPAVASLACTVDALRAE